MKSDVELEETLNLYSSEYSETDHLVAAVKRKTPQGLQDWLVLLRTDLVWEEPLADLERWRMTSKEQSLPLDVEMTKDQLSVML